MNSQEVNQLLLAGLADKPMVVVTMKVGSFLTSEGDHMEKRGVVTEDTPKESEKVAAVAEEGSKAFELLLERRGCSLCKKRKEEKERLANAVRNME